MGRDNLGLVWKIDPLHRAAFVISSSGEADDDGAAADKQSLAIGTEFRSRREGGRRLGQVGCPDLPVAVGVLKGDESGALATADRGDGVVVQKPTQAAFRTFRLAILPRRRWC